MHPNKSQKSWKSNSHLETNDRRTACKGHIATDAGAPTPGHNGDIQTRWTGNWNLMEIRVEHKKHFHGFSVTCKEEIHRTSNSLRPQVNYSFQIENNILITKWLMLEVAWKFEWKAGLKETFNYSTTGADINKTWWSCSSAWFEMIQTAYFA